MGGQNAQAVAVELSAVLVVVEALLYRSIRLAARDADDQVLLRAIGSFACLVPEQSRTAGSRRGKISPMKLAQSSATMR